MRTLYHAFGDNEPALVKAYAEAERAGKVWRGSNSHHLTAEKYAERLYYDGIRKGWIKEDSSE